MNSSSLHSSTSAQEVGLTAELPEIVPFDRDQWNGRGGWLCELYGALHTAAHYIGMEEPRGVYKIMWQHGCIAPWQQVAPEPVVYAAPKDWTMLVARGDEVRYLGDNGYKYVQSIALPFVYTYPQVARRLKNSLLVMPVHFLEKERNDVWLKAYADEIAAIRNEFDLVAVCINSSDLDHGFWEPEFRANQLPIIRGAATNGKNSLSRMRALFESFEYVTTNGWGSHCAYALYCGAKLSIWGTDKSVIRERLMLDGTWRANPAAIDRYLSVETNIRKEKVLKKFMASPHDGEVDEVLGAWLMGENHKLSPAKLKDILGWSTRKRIARLARRLPGLGIRLARRGAPSRWSS